MSSADFLRQTSFLLSRWTVVEKAVKSMSTVPPHVLLLDTSQEGFGKFVESLERKLERLERDYFRYVAPATDNTLVQVCLRFQHRVAWLGLERLIEAVRQFGRSTSLDAYFSQLCIPPKTVYHFRRPDGADLSLAADLLHELFLLTVYRHTNDRRRPRPDDDEARVGPSSSPLFYADADVDALLRYAATLASFPVVPDDLAGTLMPTVGGGGCSLKGDERIHVLEPGTDSRLGVRQLRDPRACICCRLTALQIGLTDLEELHTKWSCRCLFDNSAPSFYEKSYLCRATTVVRRLLMTKKAGCACREHVDVFREQIVRLKKALDGTMN